MGGKGEAGPLICAVIYPGHVRNRWNPSFPRFSEEGRPLSSSQLKMGFLLAREEPSFPAVGGGSKLGCASSIFQQIFTVRLRSSDYSYAMNVDKERVGIYINPPRSKNI